MRIITPGNPLKDEHTAACVFCKCKFMFFEHEAKRVQPTGRNSTVFVVECPQEGCHREIGVEK